MSTTAVHPPAAPASPPEPTGGDDAARRSTMRGSLWTVAGYGSAQVLRFGANLVLTRLLFEEAFGTMAILNSLVLGLQLFSDVGIVPAIVQNKRGDDPEFLNVAWTIQVVRGLGLWAVACALTYPFAAFYGDDALLVFVPIAAATTIATGLCSTKLHSLRRHTRIAELTTLELATQAFASVVMIAWAWVQPSLWALVGGTLAGQVFRAVLSHRLQGVRNRLCWNPEIARELFRFGKWIFLSTLLTFCATQSDRLIFGKMIPRDLLGIYSIAFMVSMLPTEAIGKVGSTVFFPQLSKIHHRGGDFCGMFTAARQVLGVLGGYLVAGMIATAPPAIAFLYDARYQEAGWMLQILAAGAWFRILESSISAALLAKGHVRWMAASQLAKVLAMVVMIPLGFTLYGFAGALAGLALASAVKYAVDCAAATLSGLPVLRNDLLLTLWVATSGLAALPLATTLTAIGGSSLAVALGTGVAVTAAWAPLGWRLKQR